MIQEGKSVRMWAIIGVGLSLFTLPAFVLALFGLGLSCAGNLYKDWCNVNNIILYIALIYNIGYLLTSFFFLLKPNSKMAGKMLIVYIVFLILFLLFIYINSFH